MNGMLKQEFLTQRCNAGRELKALISESIVTYNQTRPHLSFKIKTPNVVHKKIP